MKGLLKMWISWKHIWLRYKTHEPFNRVAMQKITTFLMFNGRAEEAIKFYISLFKQSEIVNIAHYGANEQGTLGTVKQGVFSLNGQEFMCIDSNANHGFTFTPAI